MTQSHGLSNATVRRWQLTETLRKLREEAQLTHDGVVAKLKNGNGKWSRPKLSRIENREQGVKTTEVAQLLDVYGVTDRELRDWILELADTTRTRSALVELRKSLPDDFHGFLNLEVALVASHSFETLLVPGLLQTAEYAHAVISGIHPGLTEEEAGSRVNARLARQQVLRRAEPPQLHAILDEGVLERPVGNRAVMHRQLRHLVEAIEIPHVTVQVLPKSVGSSPALEGPFSLLTLPDPIPDVGYSEGPGRAVYIEDREHVRAYTLRFGVLTEQALSQEESLDKIRSMAQEYA